MFGNEMNRKSFEGLIAAGIADVKPGNDHSRRHQRSLMVRPEPRRV